MASSNPDSRMSVTRVVRAKVLSTKKPTDLNNDELSPEAYMKVNYPDSVKFLKKWKKRYNWAPTFDADELSKLLANLSVHDAKKGRNPKYNPGHQLIAARLWCTEGKRQKNKSMKKQQVNVCAVAKKEDDDGTHCVASVQVRLNEQQNPDAGLSPSNPFSSAQIQPSAPAPPYPPPGYPALTSPEAYDAPPVAPKSQNPKYQRLSPVKTRLATGTQPTPTEKGRIYQETVRKNRRKKWGEDGKPTGTHYAGPFDPYEDPETDDDEGLYPYPGDYGGEGGDVGAFPLINLPNPNRGEHGPETIRVFRTWTQDDIKKALEGIPDPQTDVEGCISGLEELVNSYYLNGREMQRVLMLLMGHKWARVRDAFVPMSGNNSRPSEEVIAELQKNNGINAKFREMFKKTTDWGKIQQCKQGESETFDNYERRMTSVFTDNSGLVDDGEQNGNFKQALKSAILAGLREPEKRWVTKSLVSMSTTPFDTFCDYVKHAEKLQREKKKGKATQVLVSDTGAETFVFEPKKGYKGRSSQEKKKGNRKTEDQKEIDRKEGRCFICHEKGHLASDCEKRRQDKNKKPKKKRRERKDSDESEDEECTA